MMVSCAAVWGCTFVAGKIAGREATPLGATAWRLLLAAAALAPLVAVPMAARGRGRLAAIGAAGWLGLALSGLSGLILYNLFFIKGLAMVPASRGSVIACGSPALVYLGSVALFKERLSVLRCLGVLASIFGTAWVVTSGRPALVLEGGLGTGDLVMLLCPLSWAAYSLLGKVVLRRVRPVEANALSVLSASVIMLALAPALGEPLGRAAGYGPSTWLTLGFLGLCGTALSFTWFYRGIGILGPHRAAAYINLVPVFGVLAGWMVLGERPDPSLVAGLAMILAGIRLVQRY
jgi:drug/metabolite transporter (DMT)-like permease